MLTGLRSYLRARRVPATLATFAAVGAVTAAFGDLQIPALVSADVGTYAATVVLSVAPVALAVAASFGLRGDLEIWNRHAARSLAGPSIVCTVLLLVAGWAALLPAMLLSRRPDAIVGTSQNLLGAFAMVLLLGCVLRPTHVWLVLFPVAMTGLLTRPAPGSQLSDVLVVTATGGPGRLRRAAVLLVAALVLQLLVDRDRPRLAGLLRRRRWRPRRP